MEDASPGGASVLSRAPGAPEELLHVPKRVPSQDDLAGPADAKRTRVEAPDDVFGGLDGASVARLLEALARAEHDAFSATAPQPQRAADDWGVPASLRDTPAPEELLHKSKRVPSDEPCDSAPPTDAKRSRVDELDGACDVCSGASDAELLEELARVERVGIGSMAPTLTAPTPMVPTPIAPTPIASTPIAPTPIAPTLVQVHPEPAPLPPLHEPHDDTIGAWLPPKVAEAYQRKGVSQLYAWQVQCLRRVADGERHLVYSAPTSGGKSLVAEVVMLRRMLDCVGKKALFVVPLASLAEQKAASLSALMAAAELPFKVEAYFRDQGSHFLPADHPGGSSGSHLAVITIEKAASLFNRMLERKCESLLTALVVDEAHMIGDPSRGPALEALLAKVLYLKLPVQIVCMSATLPNMSIFHDWFGAEVEVTTFRPVPLKEHLVFVPSKRAGRLQVERIDVVEGERVFAPVELRALAKSAVCVQDWAKWQQWAAALWPLARETLAQGKSVLVFASSKDGCDHVARALKDLVVKDRDHLAYLMDHERSMLREAARAELKLVYGGFRERLSALLIAGVAFHHAGLSSDERQIVERCFGDGSVKLIVATSSLAMGLNMPVALVVLLGLSMGREPIKATSYAQMVGRAGRAGLDPHGDAFTLVLESGIKAARSLVTGPSEKLVSALSLCQQGEKRENLQRVLLDVIGHALVQTRGQVYDFLSHTLWWRESEPDVGTKRALVEAQLEALVAGKFFHWKPASDEHSRDSIVLLPRGLAISATWFSPSCAEAILRVVEEQARQGVMLFGTLLQLVYLVVPLDRQLELPQHKGLADLKVLLSDADKRAFVAICGGKDAFLRFESGLSRSREDAKLLLRRVWNARVVVAMLQGDKDTTEVAKAFYMSDTECMRVQALMDDTYAWASQVVPFLELMGERYRMVASALHGLLPLLEQGVSRDLIELMKIERMHRMRARSLFAAGITTPEVLATATVSDVCNALYAKAKERNSVVEFVVANALVNSAKLYVKRVESAKVSNAEARQAELERTRAELHKWRERNVVLAARPAVASPVETSESDPALGATPLGSKHSVVQSVAVCHVSDDNESQTWLALRRCAEDAKLVAFKLVETWPAALGLSSVVVAFCLNEVWEVPMDRCRSDAVRLARRAWLLQLLVDKPSVCWGSMCDLTLLHRVGISTVEARRVLDPLVYAWLCDSNHPALDSVHTLLAHYRLPAPPVGQRSGQLYADCCASFRVGVHIRSWLDDGARYPPRHLVEQEMEFVGVVAAIGAHGIGFDPQAFAQVELKLQAKLTELKLHVAQTTGGAVVGGVAARADSVDRSVERCQVLGRLLAEYRRLLGSLQHGRVRCVWSTTSSRTGRLSTASPNLQCVPTALLVPFTPDTLPEPDFHNFAHKEALEYVQAQHELCVSLRSSFVPTRSHAVLISADYVQLELRVIAHLSGDESLVALLRQRDGDVFCKVAALVLRKSTVEISEAERASVKGVVYGMAYGMGARALADRLGVSHARAQQLMTAFNDAYPGVRRWKEAVVRDAYTAQYVATLGERRRYISPPFKAEHARQVVNTVCQGSAADIMREAMVRVHKRVVEPLDAPVVLQVHDELVIECSRATLQQVVRVLRDAMENAWPQLAVPLPVRIAVGDTWGDMRLSE